MSIEALYAQYIDNNFSYSTTKYKLLVYTQGIWVLYKVNSEFQGWTWVILAFSISWAFLSFFFLKNPSFAQDFTQLTRTGSVQFVLIQGRLIY